MHEDTCAKKAKCSMDKSETSNQDTNEVMPKITTAAASSNNVTVQTSIVPATKVTRGRDETTETITSVKRVKQDSNQNTTTHNNGEKNRKQEERNESLMEDGTSRACLFLWLDWTWARISSALREGKETPLTLPKQET